MPRTPHYYAVITGDIVHSRKLPPDQLRSVQQAIKAAGDELYERHPGKVVLRIQLFRGDGWQLLLHEPADALRFALFIRARVRSASPVADSRFAIGVGTVDDIPEANVGIASGEAFTLSGQLLDSKEASLMRFTTWEHPNTRGDEHAIPTILSVLDVIVSRWTSAQATAVAGALLRRNQQQIAMNWPHTHITQQSAAQHLSRAGWSAVNAALEYYEDVMR
jgi:hypothetical protein